MERMTSRGHHGILKSNRTPLSHKNEGFQDSFTVEKYEQNWWKGLLTLDKSFLMMLVICNFTQGFKAFLDLNLLFIYKTKL